MISRDSTDNQRDDSCGKDTGDRRHSPGLFSNYPLRVLTSTDRKLYTQKPPSLDDFLPGREFLPELDRLISRF